MSVKYKKIIKLSIIYIIVFTLIISMGIILFIKISQADMGKKGGAVKYGVHAELGENPVGYVHYNTMITR